MPLKETKGPKGSGKAEAKATPNGNLESEGAWKLSSDGKKIRQGRALPLENKLKEVLLGAGALVGLQDEFVGLAVTNKAPEIAYGWAKLASEEPRVKRALEFILEGSAWSEALLPTVTLMLAIAWHYGIFVPDKLGVPLSIAAGAFPVSREVEQQMKAEAKAAERQSAAAEAQRDSDSDDAGN